MGSSIDWLTPDNLTNLAADSNLALWIIKKPTMRQELVVAYHKEKNQEEGIQTALKFSKKRRLDIPIVVSLIVYLTPSFILRWNSLLDSVLIV